MMHRRRNLLLAALLLLGGCFEPDPVPLTFFGVETGPAAPDPGALLGRVRLYGQLQDVQGQGEEIADYGFLLSANRNDLETLSGDLSYISFGPYGGGDIDFDTLSPVLSPDQTLFFRAYAYGYEVDWEEGRREMYGEIRSYGFTIEVDVTYLRRSNDTAFVRVSFGNLTALNGRAEDAGLRIADNSAMQNATTLPTYGPRSADTTLLDTLPGLVFNQPYFVQPYLLASEEITGPILPIPITDGWEEVNGFTGPGRKNATALVAGGQMLVIGGCEQAVDICDFSNIPIAVLAFDPIAADGQGQWSTVPNDLAAFHKFSQGVGARIGGGFLAGSGRTGNSPNRNWYDYASEPVGIIGPNDYCDEQEPPVLYNAVAFEHNGKLYFGSGYDWATQEPTVQFWELSPGEPCPTIRPVASLPTRVGDDDLYLGREGAIVLQTAEEVYVAFGRNKFASPLPFRDVYRFHPPQEPADSGFWTFVATFNAGPGRHEAIGLSIENRAFFGFGYSPEAGYLNDWWEFRPGEANPFVARERFPRRGRRGAVGAGIGAYGYITTGEYLIDSVMDIPGVHSDCWRYHPPEE